MRKIVDQAWRTRTVPHVLIIDEINRGNLAKVFGELYFLLEYRDSNVELLYADERLPLAAERVRHRHDEHRGPLDRAGRRGDAAPVRLPAVASVGGADQRGACAPGSRPTERPTRVADLLDELNARIEDPDFKIGPSYFMRDAVHEGEGLGRTWRTSILPLLEEHHYGELSGNEVAARYGLPAIASAVDESSRSSRLTTEERGDASPEAD